MKCYEIKSKYIRKELKRIYYDEKAIKDACENRDNTTRDARRKDCEEARKKLTSLVLIYMHTTICHIGIDFRNGEIFMVTYDRGNFYVKVEDDGGTGKTV